jgi:hypothetical protein
VATDKATRTQLRSEAASQFFGDDTYSGIEIKTTRDYERAHGATWPFSDVFVKLLIQTKWPKLATNPKHAAAGRKLFTIILLYYRLGLPASEVARLCRMKPKTLESQLQRLEDMAVEMIVRGDIHAQNGESFFKARYRTSPARNLVKDRQVVTQRHSDLNFLMTLADANIQYQVLRVLAELAEQQQELQAVYQHDSELPLAA